MAQDEKKKGLQGKVTAIAAIDPVQGQQWQNLLDLSKAMTSGESQEEKDLKRVINSSSSPALVAALQEELVRLQGGKGVSLDEAMQLIEANGQSVADVLVAGINKKIGSKSYAMTHAIEIAAKKALKEAGVEVPDAVDSGAVEDADNDTVEVEE